LASVLDLASRHLLGWSMNDHHDAGLVSDALDAAVATGGGGTMPATIFHTDRGAEYTSAAGHLPAARVASINGPHRVVPG
jgi:putative transposase